MRNFYKVLGVRASSDDNRIKVAFRRRAKKVHPDLNPGNQRAEERFKELAQAYEVLSNAKSRASYDAFLASRRRETRRRFVQSAALMVGTFTLTLMSGYALVGVQAQNAPIWGAWQVTVAPSSPAPAPGKGFGTITTTVAEAGSASGTGVVSSTSSARDSKQRQAETRPAAKPHSAPGRKAEQEVAARVQRRPAATRMAAPDGERSDQVPPVGEPGWFPPVDDAPAYGLGASDLR